MRMFMLFVFSPAIDSVALLVLLTISSGHSEIDMDITQAN